MLTVKCVSLMLSLTVHSQEVVEQLEEGEAVPAVGRLNLKSCVHVSRVQTQEGLCMLHHQVRPPGEGLQDERNRHRGKGDTIQGVGTNQKVESERKETSFTQRDVGPQGHVFRTLELTMNPFIRQADHVM